MQTIKLSIIILFGLQLLSACHHPTEIRPTQPIERFDLSQVSSFHFSGKMSFSDGQDGGSGRVSWQQKNGMVSAQLKAPLGSKSWHVSEQAQGAKLVTDGQILSADTAETLISDQLGWQVPWQQLKMWVIGEPNDESNAQLKSHKDGWSLLEDGWQIEYSRFKVVSDSHTHALPHKMVARKDNFAIKISIKQWTW